MKKYVFLNDDNRIVGIQDCELFPDGTLEDKAFEFPEGFEIGTEHDYKLINGELIYDPLPVPESEPDRVQVLEEQLAALKIVLGVE